MSFELAAAVAIGALAISVIVLSYVASRYVKLYDYERDRRKDTEAQLQFYKDSCERFADLASKAEAKRELLQAEIKRFVKGE